MWQYFLASFPRLVRFNCCILARLRFDKATEYCHVVLWKRADPRPPDPCSPFLPDGMPDFTLPLLQCSISALFSFPHFPFLLSLFPFPIKGVGWGIGEARRWWATLTSLLPEMTTSSVGLIDGLVIKCCEFDNTGLSCKYILSIDNLFCSAWFILLLFVAKW